MTILSTLFDTKSLIASLARKTRGTIIEPIWNIPRIIPTIISTGFPSPETANTVKPPQNIKRKKQTTPDIRLSFIFSFSSSLFSLF